MTVAKKSAVDHPLPCEIVYEVLIRLPARTLCQCRLVCKGWQSIISDPAFVASHFAHSTSRHPNFLATIPYIHLFAPASEPVPLNYYCYFNTTNAGLGQNHIVNIHVQPSHVRSPAPVEWHNPRPVAGLICLEYSNRVEVCNPSTGYRYVVPPSTRSRSRTESNDSMLSARLASYKWTSLCYDPIVKDHKLLRSNINFKSRTVKNRIFSRGSKAWRMIPDSCYHKRMTRDEVCLNGVLYYTSVNAQGHCYLMKFYVNSERFVKGTVNLYELPGRGQLTKAKLVEYYDGRKTLVDYPEGYGCEPFYFDSIKLWVLDEADGAENWKLKTVQLPPAPRHTSPGFGGLSLAGSIHAGEVLVFVWIANSLEQFCFLYNAKTQVFTVTKLLIPFLNPIFNRFTDGLCVSDHQDSLLTFS